MAEVKDLDIEFGRELAGRLQGGAGKDKPAEEEKMNKTDKLQLPLVLGVVAAAIMIVSVERDPASWAGAVAGLALWVTSGVWAIRQTNGEGEGCEPES